MREIKFRGICAISKEIVFGDLIHGVSSKSGNMYILPKQHNLAYVRHCDPLDGVRIIPETVGQYTGLKDKNGKEIYEGDVVVKHVEDWSYTDNWEDDDPRWHQKNIDLPLKEDNRDVVTLEVLGYWLKNERYGWEGEDLQNPTDYEIIGNIHQNADLINP